MNINQCVLLFILATIPLVLASENGAALATSHTTDKLRKQIIQQQKFQIALTQDNANLSQERLKSMNVYMNNLLANLQILVHANTKSINGSLVK